MSEALNELVEVMARLRNPDGGCPWDLKQTLLSLAPYTIEEAYEVVEALEEKNHEHLCEELGDLLLQIVFLSRLAQEENLFSFDDVCRVESAKMIERHPHVFGDRTGVDTAADVLKNWEADKAQKRDQKTAENGEIPSALDGVNTALPALSRAQKLQKRAARVGFDWQEYGPFLAKIREELGEFEAEVHAASSREKMEDELGDVLFAVIGLASFLKLDPERALRSTNRKFERRFRAIETALRAQSKEMQDTPLPELEKLWREVKAGENAGSFA